MKLNGAQFKAWYASDWGDAGAYIDDYEISINGELQEDFDETAILDTDTIEIHCGVVYLDEAGSKSMDMIKHARKWLKSQTTELIVIAVDISQKAEFEALVKGFKGATIHKG